MTDTFENANVPWPEILIKIKTQFNPNEREMVMHSLIKIFNHE